MKLERFKEKDKKRTSIIIFTITCILLVSGVILYRTFAIFEVRTNQNIINGTVQAPGNIYFAFYVNDGKEDKIQKEMPTKNYVLDEEKSFCGTNGEIDPSIKVTLTDEYGVYVTGMTTSRTKCNLYFVSGTFILGKPIKAVTSNDGLYEVTHENVNGTLNDTGFKETEFRYAGTDPNNYITFNDEKWRIIGLVNVMTSEHNVEQRIKIVRDGYIGNYSWDYGDGENINDWTQSTLMEMLNGIYYNSDSGNCYKSSSPTLCDFTDTGLKNMISKSMIDKNISWNLGGAPISQDGSNGLVTNLYTYERGSEVYQEDSIQRPVEWNATNSTHFNGVGLIYPSDYGWATNGGNLNRDKCFQQDLYHWSTEEYKLQCGAFDWLTPIYWEWTISQVIASRHAFKVNPAGYSNTGSVSVDTVGHVYPVVYLKSNVKIINDQQDGSYDKPYNLKLVE